MDIIITINAITRAIIHPLIFLSPYEFPKLKTNHEQIKENTGKNEPISKIKIKRKEENNSGGLPR